MAVEGNFLVNKLENGNYFPLASKLVKTNLKIISTACSQNLSRYLITEVKAATIIQKGNAYDI